MSEATYLERRNENDPFHSALSYFSNSTKKSTVTAKYGVRQIPTPESRDDAPKRVAFHPSIISPMSGEDLAFDLTKVYSSNHRQEPSRQPSDGEKRDERSILSNGKPGIAAGGNANRPAKEVYTGMSKRCRKDLLKDDKHSRVGRILKNNRSQFEAETIPPVTARAKSYSAPPKNGSFLNELKGKFNSSSSENKPPVKVTSRWLEERRESEKVNSDEMEFRRAAMSPKKYSVSKISQARSAPTPKSDDFFSELKQWHQDYALRDVEAPSEITVTAQMKPNVKKETDKAAAKAKKNLAQADKEYAKMKKEEKALKKKMEKKEKKKFWKLASLSKKKKNFKSEEDESGEINDEQKPSESSLKQTSTEVIVETVVSDQSSIVNEVEAQDSKLEPEGEALETATTVDNQSSTDTTEKSGREAMFSELVQAAAEKTEEVGDKYKVELEVPDQPREPTDEKVEDKTSVEEKRSQTTNDVDDMEGLPAWFGKISDFFEQNNITLEDIEKAKDSPVEEIPNEMTPTTAGVEATTTATLEEKPSEGTTTTEGLDEKEGPWYGKVSGYFKKGSETIDPPVLVVEVDRYEIDKYQPFAEENLHEANDDDSVLEMREYTRDYGEASSFDNELREEVDHFLHSRCPCMGDHRMSPVITREEAKIEKMKTEHSQKESSWLDMASGLFSPKSKSKARLTDDEGTKSQYSEGDVITEKADNKSPSLTESVLSEVSVPSEAGAIDANKEQEIVNSASTFDDSILTKEEVKEEEKKPSYDDIDDSILTKDEVKEVEKKQSYDDFDDSILTKDEVIEVEKKQSYDDILLTLADGTNVIKMTALMDLYPSETCSIVEPPKLRSFTESPPCVDSKDNKKTKNQKKKCKKQVKAGATLFGNLKPSEKKQKNKKKKGNTLF